MWPGAISYCRSSHYLRNQRLDRPPPVPRPSDQVAATVRHFMDAKQIRTTNIFGYSFGAILTLNILDHIEERVDRVVFFAPAVAHYALNYSKVRKKFINHIVRFASKPKRQQWLLEKLCHNEKVLDPAIKILDRLGKTRRRDERFKNRLLNLPLSTLNVLFYQMEEIFSFDLAKLDKQYPHQVYFGMSVNDPLIHYNRTKKVLKSKFPNWQEIPFDYPFHQPPEPFTFDQLNADYYRLLNAVASEYQERS